MDHLITGSRIVGCNRHFYTGRLQILFDKLCYIHIGAAVGRQKGHFIVLLSSADFAFPDRMGRPQRDRCNKGFPAERIRASTLPAPRNTLSTTA